MESCVVEYCFGLDCDTANDCWEFCNDTCNGEDSCEDAIHNFLAAEVSGDNYYDDGVNEYVIFQYFENSVWGGDGTEYVMFPYSEGSSYVVPSVYEGDWIQGGDFNYIANTLPPTDVLLCTVADFSTGLYPDSDCVDQVEGAGCSDSGFGFDYGKCRPYPSARTIKNSIFETCESTEPITDEALLESYLENSKLRTTQYQEDGTTYQNGDFGYSNGYALPYLDSGKGYIFKTQLGVNFCLKLTQPEPNL